MELDLRNISGRRECNFSLGADYLTQQEGSDIKGGCVDVDVVVEKRLSVFEVRLHIEGSASLECDRCLDLMEMAVETDEVLCVKFGDGYFDNGDGTIVVDEREGLLDVGWLAYEFVAMRIPAQHVHADGGCNKEMLAYLSANSGAEKQERENNTMDPRWEKLKGITNI